MAPLVCAANKTTNFFSGLCFFLRKAVPKYLKNSQENIGVEFTFSKAPDGRPAM